MMVDGQSAASVAERLGISQVNLLYRWKALAVSRGGPAAKGLDNRVSQLQDELSDSLVLESLQHAIRNRQPPPGLIHHSDRGGKYASHRLRGVMRRAHIRQSMSRVSNCYDNAFMESCFGTIKTVLEMTEYENSSGARKDIASYLTYYNYERPHSALDYLSPHHCENAQAHLN